MIEGRAKVGDVELAYEVHGSVEAPAIIGLQGLAEGRRFWPKAFTHAIVEQGYRVVLIDNRDIGDSSVLSASGPVDLDGLLAGRNVKTPYSLIEMAQDTVGVMDHLQLTEAHIIGYSLGGMITQWMAINHAERCSSLVLVMTSSGDPTLEAADADAFEALVNLARGNANEDVTIERLNTLWEAMQGDSCVEEERDAFVKLLLRTGYRPEAISRQLGAGLATPSRLLALSKVSIPTTVIHGACDRMFPLDHGRDLARRVSGARLKEIQHAGHALSTPVTDHLIDMVSEHLSWVTEAPRDE